MKPRIGFVNFYPGSGNTDPTIHYSTRDARRSAEEGPMETGVPFVECTPEILQKLSAAGFCPFLHGRELI
jgi:hypothetical protein